MIELLLVLFLAVTAFAAVIILDFFIKIFIFLFSEDDTPPEAKLRSHIALNTLLFISAALSVYFLLRSFKLGGIYGSWYYVILIAFLFGFFILVKTFLNGFIGKIKKEFLVNINGFAAIMYILLIPLTFPAYLVLKKHKQAIAENKISPNLSEDELLDIIEQDSELEEDEKDMITSIIGLSDIKANEIMIPRTSVVAVDTEEDYDSIIKLFKSKGFSRIPVYRENIDEIIGVLYVKDIIGVSKEAFSLSNLMRKPVFMPETVKLDELLKIMIEKKMQLIVILDEYGGTAGIVTMEDIIEEIIGEVEDEYEKHSKEIDKIEKNTYKIKASLEIEYINETLGVQIPKAENIETIGGFILSVFEKIPQKGETLEYHNLHFRILESDERKIKWVLLNVKQKT